MIRRTMVRFFNRFLLNPMRDEASRTRGKIENIQALRGVAILLVVLAHLTAIEQKYGHGDGILPHFFAFGVSGVDLFFVISGFVVVTVTRHCFKQPFAVGHFFYNRVSRVYPLYWLYSLAVLGIYLLRPEMVNAAQGHRVNILESFMLLPQDLLPLLNVGWALVHVMYFYLVFTLLLFAPERQFPTLTVVWALAVVMGNLVYRYAVLTGPTASIKLITHPLTLEFIGGCLVAKLIHSGTRQHGFKALVLGGVLFITGMSIYYSGSPGPVPKGWLRAALFGFPYAIVVYGAVALEMNSARIFPRFLSFVGDASYSIYLSHVFVLSAIGRTWSMVSRRGPLDNIIMILLGVIVAIIVGRVSYRIIEIPMLSLARRVKGSRKIDSLPAVPTHRSQAEPREGLVRRS
jgi:exopolysaccharide production protein ExoZ